MENNLLKKEMRNRLLMIEATLHNIHNQIELLKMETYKFRNDWLEEKNGKK